MIDPGTYRILSFTDINRSKSRGFNFGTERNNMKNTLKNNLQIDPDIPGPASYRDHEVYKLDSRYKAFNLGRIQTSEPRFREKDDRILKQFPGPGSYSPNICNLDNSGGAKGSKR